MLGPVERYAVFGASPFEHRDRVLHLMIGAAGLIKGRLCANLADAVGCLAQLVDALAGELPCEPCEFVVNHVRQSSL